MAWRVAGVSIRSRALERTGDFGKQSSRNRGWRTLAGIVAHIGKDFGHAASQTRAQRCAAHGKRCFGASHRNFGFSLRRVAGGFSHEVCRAAPRVRIIGSGCTGEKPASLKASATGVSPVVHSALGQMPAQAAGITGHEWTNVELLTGTN